MRKIIFANGNYYHIYNRGVNKMDVFLDNKDYWKFFDCLRDFNNKTLYDERLNALGLSIYSRNGKNADYFPFRELGSFLEQQERVIDIISYSINPNHFHLIVKQLVDGGVSNLMHKTGLSMPKYFNKKYEHSGHIFQGPFKAIEIDSEEYLLWLLGYVNGNVEIHGIEKVERYKWASYQAICQYLEGKKLSSLSALSGLEIIKENLLTAEKFKELIKIVIKESSEKKKIEKQMKKYLLEK